MTYVKPFEVLLGVKAEDARQYYEQYLEPCIKSGMTYKLVGEYGLFSGRGPSLPDFSGYRMAMVIKRGEHDDTPVRSKKWKIMRGPALSLDSLR